MKFLSYILSSIFVFAFFLILVVFHPVQWIAFKVFGFNGHKHIVDLLNFCLTKSLLILGVTVKFKNEYNIPTDKTVIFVSNHQSMFDIPPLIWKLRKHHAKFVSKIELSKGIPSVSYNLRVGGAALINRKDPKQALTALMTFSKKINTEKWSTVIFPEGTRSRDGKPKSFSPNGLKMLSKYNKDGLVVPITINNSWKVFKYGKFPLGLGSPIVIEVHEPIMINSMPFVELLDTVESKIKSNIK